MFHVLIVVGSGRMMSVNDNTDKAVSLLREAAILLSGGRESEGNQDTASSTVGRSLTSPETVDQVAPKGQRRKETDHLGEDTTGFEKRGHGNSYAWRTKMLK